MSDQNFAALHSLRILMSASVPVIMPKKIRTVKVVLQFHQIGPFTRTRQTPMIGTENTFIIARSMTTGVLNSGSNS